MLAGKRMATSGEPSTWFPLGKVVEQERSTRQNFQNFKILRNFRNFRPKIQLSKNFKPIDFFLGLLISLFYELYPNL